MSLTLHKVTCQNDVDDVDVGHVFTFVWDDVAKLQLTSSWSSVRSIESSEVKYAGHSWTIVCTRKVSFVLNIITILLLLTSCKYQSSGQSKLLSRPCGPLTGVLLAFTRWHLLLRYCYCCYYCARVSLLFARCRCHEFY